MTVKRKLSTNEYCMLTKITERPYLVWYTGGTSVRYICKEADIEIAQKRKANILKER